MWNVALGFSVRLNIFFNFQVLGILAEPVPAARAQSITYSILFLVVGSIVGLAMFLQVSDQNRFKLVSSWW